VLSKLLRHALRSVGNSVTSRLLPPLARLHYGSSLEAYQPFHLVHVGNQYLFLGKHDRAIEFFLAACKKNPETRWTSGQHLVNYVTTRQLDDDSHFHLLREVTSAPDFVVPDLEAALLRGALKRDPDRLEEEFKSIPAGRPSRQALEALGSDVLAIGRNKFALALYRRALGQRPDNPVLLEQIGVTEFLTGLYQEAEATFAFVDYQKFLERRHGAACEAQYAVLDHTWLLAIGHVAFLDTYIKACKLGWYSEKKSVLVYDQRSPPAGWPLLKFFSKHLDIIGTERPLHEKLDEIIAPSPTPAESDATRERRRTAVSRSFWYGPDGDGRIRWYAPWGAAVETAWKERGNRALFSLSDEERKLFRQRMAQAYGLPEDAWFVLVHVREPGFHAHWHAHHAGTRNAEIKAYSEVFDFVLSKGGWVVRGGDSSMRPLTPRERVIDYAASTQKHPAIDIYLCAECAYFIGTNSGFSLIPPIFGKRCGLTNWSPIAIPNWYLDDVYIPKLVRKTSEGRYLSFKEMYTSFAGWSQFARDFANTDFVIEDNSPEDLRELAEELHDETFGASAAPTREDQDRLRHFNKIVTTHGGYVGSRMGYRFMKKYGHLLD
jgi:putative glycosyltransferase (TIGR04372 family)